MYIYSPQSAVELAPQNFPQVALKKAKPEKISLAQLQVRWASWNHKSCPQKVHVCANLKLTCGSATTNPAIESYQSTCPHAAIVLACSQADWIEVDHGIVTPPFPSTWRWKTDGIKKIYIFQNGISNATQSRLQEIASRWPWCWGGWLRDVKRFRIQHHSNGGPLLCGVCLSKTDPPPKLLWKYKPRKRLPTQICKDPLCTFLPFGFGCSAAATSSILPKPRGPIWFLIFKPSLPRWFLGGSFCLSFWTCLSLRFPLSLSFWTCLCSCVSCFFLGGSFCLCTCLRFCLWFWRRLFWCYYLYLTWSTPWFSGLPFGSCFGFLRLFFLFCFLQSSPFFFLHGVHKLYTYYT